jgi:hypothetical protein
MGDSFLESSAIIRPWDFVPNHPDQFPDSLPVNPETGLQTLPYSPVPVQFNNDTAIVIILSERSFQTDGVTPEVNPVSNINLEMDVYIESPKIPAQGETLEQPEITDHFNFNINGPGTDIGGKKVFTIYLINQNFDTDISRFLGKRCYFSIGIKPQLTTRLSKNWHSTIWDQAVPSSAIPGDFFGTTTFIEPRNASGTITIDSVEIKKVPQTGP